MLRTLEPDHRTVWERDRQFTGVVSVQVRGEGPFQSAKGDLRLGEDRRHPPEVSTGLTEPGLLVEPRDTADSLPALRACLDASVACVTEDRRVLTRIKPGTLIVDRPDRCRRRCDRRRG